MTDMNNLDLFAERDRAEEFCSLIIANGYVPMDDFRDVLYNENLRREIEQRLDRVGLRLLYNLNSQYWGVGLNSKTGGDERLEWSNNFGLSRGAMALLLILWTKLVLPKRLEQDAKREKEASLFDDSLKEFQLPPETPRVSISRDQILSEFGKVLGGAGNVSKYLSQLARANLIRYYAGIIEEGPLLSLVIREEELNEELRREVLLYTLRGRQNIAGDEPDSEDEPDTEIDSDLADDLDDEEDDDV